MTIGPHTDVTGRTDRPGRVVIGYVTEDVPEEFQRIKAVGAKVVRAPFHPVDDPKGWLASLADGRELLSADVADTRAGSRGGGFDFLSDG